TYGAVGETSKDVQQARPKGTSPSPVFEPTPYVNNTIKMFDHLRAKVGFDVELIHDVHERVPPAQAIQLAKALEPFRLFFLEDCFAPEDAAWFQPLGPQTPTPRGDGGAVRQPPRMAAPGGQPVDRLHPTARLRGRRPKHGPKGRGLL